MDFCRTVDLLYTALPLRPLRGWLIRGHMERCPRCQARLLSREEARGLLVAPDGVGNADAIWRQISSQAGRLTAFSETRPAMAGAKWRWAAAAATAAVIAVTGFWLLREVEKPGFGPTAAGPADRFEIDYVNVGGAPAQTFVFQPQGTDTVFVWASKNL
ncbi:MAG: hypothetical protein A2V57_04010 [Candidatus Aminicenantes bacterium RBG_19FT_COMBO_65_30]|nr:MAG: hypothetical protein A2V57_04010 [Candidatus Aminicenantes bacterium RBG_19FT_COMBO_65_30]